MDARSDARSSVMERFKLWLVRRWTLAAFARMDDQMQKDLGFPAAGDVGTSAERYDEGETPLFRPPQRAPNDPVRRPVAAVESRPTDVAQPRSVPEDRRTSRAA